MAKTVHGLLITTLLTLFTPCASAQESKTPLVANDISIMFPSLNKHLSPSLSPYFIAATDMAKYGTVLPKNIFKRLPLMGGKVGDQSYPHYHLVGVRIDPCFPTTPDLNGPCEAQLRAVMQLYFNVEDKDAPGTYQAFAVDNALHLFYPLKTGELPLLIKKIAELRIKHSSHPWPSLTPNPILAQEQLQGPYSRELRKILLSHMGAQRLTQVTLATLSGGPHFWFFAGLELKQGQWREMRITDKEKKIQRYSTMPHSESILPVDHSADSLEEFLSYRNNAVAADQIDPSQQQAAIRLINSIENPRIHSPQTMSCVSCHVTGVVKTWLKASSPPLGRLNWQEKKYPSALLEYNPGNILGNPKVVRSFGHMYYSLKNANVPVINQRVANETWSILQQLSQRDEFFLAPDPQ